MFSNLIVFDQHKPQVSLDTIVSDLATSWSWNEDDTALTFQLHQDVKWHDGKPFAAADVKCTWDLLGSGAFAALRSMTGSHLIGCTTDGSAAFHL